MSDSRISDLINGEIDGTNTAAESDELRGLLQENPVAKKEFENLRRIVHAMESRGLEPVPEGHIERILAAIPYRTRGGSTAGVPADPGGGWFAWLSGALGRPGLRLAGSFAAGAVVGAVVWVGWSGGGRQRVDYPLDNSTVSGTMKSIEQTEGFARVGDLGIQAGNVTGAFQLLENEPGSALLAELTLSSPTPVEWVVDYDGAGVSFEGFRRFDGGDGVVAAGGTQTRATHVGDGRYILFFSTRTRPTQPMTVRIFSAGELLFEQAVSGNSD